MDGEPRAVMAARLVEVEERLDRIGKRITAGYGTDSDRDGWLQWLRQLTAERDRLRAALAGPGDRQGTDDAAETAETAEPADAAQGPDAHARPAPPATPA